MHAVAQSAGSVTAALLTPGGSKAQVNSATQEKKVVIFLPSKTTKYTNRRFINGIIENSWFKVLCILEKNLF